MQKNFTGTGANVVAKLIQQRESFEAHGRMYGEASGLEGTKYNRSDPTAAMGEVSKSLETFLGVVSSPIMVQAAHGLDAIATGISAMSMHVDAFEKAHPDAAKTLFPAAAGAAVIGSGAASLALFKAFSGGFGLKGSAAALDHSALALDAAAARLGAGGGMPGVVPGAEPGKTGKRSFLGSAGRVGLGVAGAFGLEPLAQIAEDKHILAMPDLGKDGWGRSALNFLDPNFGNLVLGEAKKTGTEAGEKAGDGLKEGIKAKTPETVEQAQTLYDRLKKVFENPIYIPMSFEGAGGGGGGSLIQKASFGGGGNGGLGGFSGGGGYAGTPVGDGGGGGGIVRASPGIGGGVGRVGSVRGISARDMRDVHPEMAAYIRAAALANGIDPNVALRIANSEGLRGSIPGVRNTPGDKGTSFGPFQLHYASRIPGLRNGGLGDRYTRETGHHASDPKYWKEQIDFALRTARREGWGAWHGRYGAGIGLRDGIGTVRPVPMSEQARQSGGDGEPRLVKGLDGKEGLDLGDGTMKMPDGSIRSITNGGGAPRMPDRTVPDAPQADAGLGNMQAAADRMHAAAARMEEMTVRTHHTFEVNASPEFSAKIRKMRRFDDGPVTGNLGISMAHTERA